MIRIWAVGYALLFLVLHTTAIAEEPIPLEHFTKSDELGTMKISPDGMFIAMTSGQQGAEYLTFFDLSQNKVTAGVRAPERFAIHDFHWASNTRVIFMIAEQQLGNKYLTDTGEIFAVDRDGKQQLRIYGYRAGDRTTGTHIKGREASYASPSIVSLLDKDDRYILISEMAWKLKSNGWHFDPDARPKLTRLDTYRGMQTTVGHVPLPDATVIVDREDQPRFAIGRTGGLKLSVVWKRDANADWQGFEVPGFRNSTVVPQRFTADNQAVLFTGVRDGERHSALFRLQLEDQSVTQLIAIPDADVDSLIMDFQDREAIGVAGYSDKAVTQWLLPEHPSAKLQRALQRAFVGNEVSFISKSADGKRAIVFVQSDVAPGEYLLFDTQTKQADMLRAARTWIDIKKMRPKESIKVTARDGLELNGYLTRPNGSGPYPLIVLPHGGPHFTRDDWSFDTEAQLFASRGYAVLQVNFRGSGGYGAEFQAKGYGEWGGRMQDDITDATRWAIDQKIAAPDRVCIYGASYGGYAALMGAAREPMLYRCAIGYAGVYDLELMFESGDVPDSRNGLEYLKNVLGTDAAGLRARSPVHLAEKIQAPVLLIHGTEDWRADYKHATRMKAALEQHSKPVEWLKFRGEGHGVYDDATRLEMYTAVLKFLDTHLSVRRTAAQ